MEKIKYRTSKRIQFASDKGGNGEETHLEIEWPQGRTLMVDITDEKIHIAGPCFDVDKHSVNAMDITLHKFEKQRG